MKGIEKQKELFKALKEEFGSKKFAERISEVLCISEPGAYRRISGETLLTINDLVLISEAFEKSFNELMSYKPEDEVIFKFNYDNQNQTFGQYINEITESLDYVRSFEDHIVIYSAKDLPPWHYFDCPFLRTFKIFYWLRSINQDPKFKNENFHFDIIPDEFHEAAKDSLKSFRQVNSEEIWTPSSLNIMLGQIGYYYDSGIIDKEQFQILTDKLLLLLDRLQSEIAIGKKTTDKKIVNEVGTYKVFLSEIIGGDNVIYARGGVNQMLFHPPVLMNYIHTKDQKFCNYIHTSFDVAKGTAELISAISERRRKMFFNEYKHKVHILKKKYSSFNMY